MEFSRQEYWGGWPFLSPGDLLNPGIEPGSPALQACSLQSEPPGKPFLIYMIQPPAPLPSLKIMSNESESSNPLSTGSAGNQPSP